MSCTRLFYTISPKHSVTHHLSVDTCLAAQTKKLSSNWKAACMKGLKELQCQLLNYKSL